MGVIQFIVSLFITILSGAVALALFILVQHKKEIWDCIVFKEEGEDNFKEL